MTTTLATAVQRAVVLHGQGVAALQSNQALLAAELIGQAVQLDPSSLAALVNYAAVLQELERFEDAVHSCDRAIALDPNCPQAFYNRGNALRALSQHSAAVASYDRAIALAANYADAYLNRGLALSALNRSDDAIASYEAAIRISPASADPYFNRANELRCMNRFEAAVASYEQAIKLQPGFAAAHVNRGAALVELHRYADAFASFDKAIACQPSYAEAYFNRAAVLQRTGQYAAAVASYDQGLAHNPRQADAHAGRGWALRELKRYDAAIASYDHALALDPCSMAHLGARRHVQMQICDWDGLEEDVAKLRAGVDGPAAAANPFFLLNLCDSAELQQRAATRWVAARCPGAAAGPQIPPRDRLDRIQVGYFSADFHEHATAYLIAQLLELHDKSRFRITAFSFGPPSAGKMRKRLQAACDEFIDVRHLSDAAVVALARSRGIDIAVDLKGFTQDNRLGIFARRAAPVQVNFLGYPGTMGAEFMDYLIADRTLVPMHGERHFSEKIIFLPHSYQVNDATRAISARSFTRAELNLPASGFVFCCFNNAYKITPALFERWMRILARVEGSVLWLLGDNPDMQRNLRREAAACGVERQRLIFANRVDLPDHLARQRAADLFLDTLPCNAHTTASDALWAGVPVLTCPGESLAARVAASLLTAIGIPDLIAPTPQHYEDMACHWATQPQELADIRERLRKTRLTAPLFDTTLYCKHLELALTNIHENHLAGAPRNNIDVPSGGVV